MGNCLQHKDIKDIKDSDLNSKPESPSISNNIVIGAHSTAIGKMNLVIGDNHYIEGNNNVIISHRPQKVVGNNKRIIDIEAIPLLSIHFRNIFLNLAKNNPDLITHDKDVFEQKNGNCVFFFRSI
jgi:hypothetical protein